MAVADVIREIFERYGWDFAEYARLSAASPFEAIVPLNAGWPTPPTNFGGLHIRTWMRFGNSVIQLSNLAALCEKYDIPAVYFEEDHPFFDAAQLAKSTGVPFVRRSARAFVASDGIVLSSTFFFADPYGLFAGRERQATIDKHLSVLLPEDFVSGHPLIDDDTITMHFRAGDAFISGAPGDEYRLAHYGQPPLAYYELALRHSGAKRAVVVCEDMRNPTTAAFMDHARALGREVILQSADLRSDLAVLFNSTELVTGIGSFLWSINALSKRLKKFWFFQRVFDDCTFARHHIRMAAVSDREGGYNEAIMHGTWANRPDQLKLMLEYPVSALSLNEW
jgi:hypothetical protein